jgi:hypothetical protein
MSAEHQRSVAYSVLLLGLLTISSAPARAGAQVSVALEVVSASAAASPRSKKRVGEGTKQSSSTKRSSGAITVPIDVGLGPIGLLGAQDLAGDQLMHGGLVLSIAAVIDRQLIQQYQDRVPARYRAQLKRVDTLYYRPWWLVLVPETLVLSPPIWNTGVYGAIWRPAGIGFPLKLGASSLTFGARLDLCYLFLHSVTLPTPTHFLRPGVNLHATFLLPLTELFLVSTGWSSDFFVPQPLGEPPWAFVPLDHALWHLGGPFLKLHFRVPYTVSL